MLGSIEVGENIRDRTARSSAQQTLDLLSSLGQFVWVERNGDKQQIPIALIFRFWLQSLVTIRKQRLKGSLNPSFRILLQLFSKSDKTGLNQ